MGTLTLHRTRSAFVTFTLYEHDSNGSRRLPRNYSILLTREKRHTSITPIARLPRIGPRTIRNQKPRQLVFKLEERPVRLRLPVDNTRRAKRGRRWTKGWVVGS
jgi:hypothetical protein